MDTDKHQSSVDSIRIAIIGSDAVSRHALQVLLEERLNATVLDSSPTLENLNSLTVCERPDIVLFDGDSLVDVAQDVALVREIDPELATIVLSTRPEIGAAAKEAGAEAFVNKIDPPRRLLTTIARIRLRDSRGQ